jgi:hypothetical protein
LNCQNRYRPLRCSQATKRPRSARHHAARGQPLSRILERIPRRKSSTCSFNILSRQVFELEAQEYVGAIRTVALNELGPITAERACGGEWSRAADRTEARGQARHQKAGILMSWHTPSWDRRQALSIPNQDRLSPGYAQPTDSIALMERALRRLSAEARACYVVPGRGQQRIFEAAGHGRGHRSALSATAAAR